MSEAALGGCLLLAALAVGATGARLQIKQPPRRSQDAVEAPILAVEVKSFKIQNVGMAGALLALRSKDVDSIVIGFERIPHPAGQKGGPISLTVRDGTFGEIVRRLCQADPRYEYQVIRGSMIDVRPKGSLKDSNDMLNMRIEHYSVDAKNAGALEAIEHINEHAPELRQFLYRKAEEWIKRTGIASGSPGSIMSGNMPPPPFILDLRNVTVRQILDAISLKSIALFNEGPRYDARGLQTTLAPTGWEYDFVLNPAAATGLGGYPSWKPF